MLKKFIAIKNVGKFRNCAAIGDIEFRKLSLVYAENGRGKTTLSAILRSLESGDPLLITERRTVDGVGDPHIDVMLGGGKLTFAGNAWTAKYENLVVFDSTYVTENVYSGDSVEHDHKKRLYQVSIGKQGVELAKKVTDLDAKSREIAARLTTSNKNLSKSVPEGMTLEQFLALAKDDDIDSKIANQKKSLAALADAEAIKTRSAFTKLTAPLLPDGLSEMLAKVLDGVSKDAEIKIQNHIAAHKMGAEGQSWITTGLSYLHNDSCPFCGLNVSGNDLLQAYGSYFSEAYDNFKNKIKTFESDFLTAFSEKRIAALNTTLVQNQANLEFWKKYVTPSLPEILFDEKTAPAIQKTIDSIAPLIQKKISAPLDSVTFSPEAQNAVEALIVLKAQIDDYNGAVDAANPGIAALKRAIEAGNSAALRKELTRLEAQKKRHSDEIAPACTEHATSQIEKNQTETEKGNTKRTLDEYTETVLQKYQEGINKLLDIPELQAGFSLFFT
jgi:wobble nucleotide-excising tRNase